MIDRGNQNERPPAVGADPTGKPVPGQDQRGLSPGALRALRVAATLASVATDIRVRVGNGVRTVVEVRRPPFPDVDAHMIVPPCHFRIAVGRAYAQNEAGQPVEMAGLDGVREPVVDIGLPAGDAVLTGDVYRLCNGDEWTFMFATGLGIDAARSSCQGLDRVWLTGTDHQEPCRGAPPRDPQAVRVAFHHDDVTRITLVHTSVPEMDFARAEVHLAALHEALARCTTNEFVANVLR